MLTAPGFVADTARMKTWNPRAEKRRKGALSNAEIVYRMRETLGDLAPSESTVAAWFRPRSKGPKRDAWKTAYRSAIR